MEIRRQIFFDNDYKLIFPKKLTFPKQMHRRTAGTTSAIGRFLGGILLAAMFSLFAIMPVKAQAADQTFDMSQVLEAGHKFFGTVSENLAKVVENAFSRHGRPTGYILGEEASAAIIIGGRYGEGDLTMKNAESRRVFWQGPSVGADFGAEGARVMILVYNMDSGENLFRRFTAISGSAYIVGGFGMTALGSEYINLIPIRSGVGARLGINAGYVKFTREPTWNPF